MVDFIDLDPFDDDPQFDGGLELGEEWPGSEYNWENHVYGTLATGEALCPQCRFPFIPTIEHPGKCRDCYRRS